MPKDNSKHWLQSLIEKNAWGVIVGLVAAGILFSSISGKVAANAYEVDRLKTVVEGITANQTQILLIQQQQANTSNSIMRIEKDIEAIKQAIGKL